jgi:hypothetical protein
MTTHKNSTISIFALLTCMAIIALSNAAPHALDGINMKFYGSYINFDEYVNRLVRFDIGCAVMNFIVLICCHSQQKVKNHSIFYGFLYFFFQGFLYVLLALQSLPNIKILLYHYNHNIANPSEMSVFDYLTDEFGWAAHLFYAVPLLSLIFPIMIWLIYKGITKSS